METLLFEETVEEHCEVAEEAGCWNGNLLVHLGPLRFDAHLRIVISISIKLSSVVCLT